MKKITNKFLYKHFDYVMGRVERGESFTIVGKNRDVKLSPSFPFAIQSYSDEFIQKYQDHDEGC